MWLDDFSELKRRLDQIQRDQLQTVPGGDLRAFLSARPQLLRDLAAEDRITDVNRSALELYEAPDKDEFRAAGLAATFCEQSYQTFLEELLLIAAGKTRFSIEMQHLTHRGTPLEVELHWAVAPGSEDSCAHLYVSVLDITDRKRAERELRQTEERWQLALEGAGHGVWDFNVEADRKLVSSSVTEMLGYSEQVFDNAAETWADLIHPADRELVVRETEKHFQGEMERATLEYRLRRHDGRYMWVQGRGRITERDADETPRRGIRTITDISERKAMERRLHESEAMFRSIAEDGFDVVLLLNLQGEFLYLNHAAGQALDLPLKKIIRHNPLEFVYRPDRPIVVRAFTELQRGSVHVHPPAYRLVTRSGNLAWWDSRGTMLFNDAGEPEKILVIGRDITRYKRSEERITSLLREKDLLLKETHHRIKNHMSVIAGYLRYQAETQASEEHRRTLQEAASRAQGLMILYDRLYRTHERSTLSIREYLPPLVEETVRLLEHGVPVTVFTQVEDFHFDSRTLGVLGIMVTELITNSIKHGFRDGAAGRITITAQQQGNSATLQYSDTGVGITAERKQQKERAVPPDGIGDLADRRNLRGPRPQRDHLQD